MAAPTSTLHERVLILDLLNRDSALARDALSGAGITAEVVRGMEALCEAIVAGAGAVLVTEESLTAQTTQLLLKTLEREPSWSDLPIMVLTTSAWATDMSLRTIRRLGPTANVSFLERPVRTVTLVAAVRAALRARRRQYDVRDYLESREEVRAVPGAQPSAERLVDRRSLSA